MAKTTENTKDINTFLSKDFFTFFGIFTGIITLVLGIKIYQSNFKFIFSFTFLPILCGLFFEQRRLGYSWKEIMFTSFSSYCVTSLGLLIALQNEQDHAEFSTSFLFFIFVISFIVISISYAYYLKTNYKITARLTEGILLLQSISLFYLFVTENFWGKINFLDFLLTGFFISNFAYVIYHSFSSQIHTKKSKLYLSVSSSFIALTFSIFYFLKIFGIDTAEVSGINNMLVIMIQFFLFGVSIIYAAQNFWLIIRFLPEKGESSESYKSRLEILKMEHIERFFDRQIHIYSSLFCLIFVGGIYFLNFKFRWIPSYTMIWLVFTFFPFVIYLWEICTLKKRLKNN